MGSGLVESLGVIFIVLVLLPWRPWECVGELEELEGILTVNCSFPIPLPAARSHPCPWLPRVSGGAHCLIFLACSLPPCLLMICLSFNEDKALFAKPRLFSGSVHPQADSGAAVGRTGPSGTALPARNLFTSKMSLKQFSGKHFD